MHRCQCVWSSGTWYKKKDPRGQTLSRPPVTLSRRDLSYTIMFVRPDSTSLHPHVKPCSRVRRSSSLSQTESSHTVSLSAVSCVVYSYTVPVMTPTPHSPVFVDPGVDASSGIHPATKKPKIPSSKHPQISVSHHPSSTNSDVLTQTPPHTNTTCPLPLVVQVREPHPVITHAPPH
jgi:hypothetical protein